MSTIPALGARHLPASLYAANQQHSGKTTGTHASQQVKGADAAPAALSDSGLDLQKHLASVGNATVDYAQNLLGSFAQSLFGDAGKNASISFDSASLEAESSVGVAVQHSEGPSGTSDAAALQLTDSSHFIGKGTITTADGRKFDFEVEVQYDYELDAAASQTSSGSSQPPSTSTAPATTGSTPVTAGNPSPTASTDPAKAGNPSSTSTATSTPTAGTGNTSSDNSNTLPTVQVPNIDFPGTLSDLFKLIGRDLQTALSTGGNDNSKTSNGIDRNTLRSLSLRLLNLVNSKDTNTYSAPTSADKAKSVASTYGVPATTDASSATATPVSSTAAAAANDTPASTATTAS